MVVGKTEVEAALEAAVEAALEGVVGDIKEEGVGDRSGHLSMELLDVFVVKDEREEVFTFPGFEFDLVFTLEFKD